MFSIIIQYCTVLRVAFSCSFLGFQAGQFPFATTWQGFSKRFSTRQAAQDWVHRMLISAKSMGPKTCVENLCQDGACSKPPEETAPGSSTDKKATPLVSEPAPHVEVDGWQDITETMLRIDMHQGPSLPPAAHRFMQGSATNVLSEGETFLTG